MEAVAIVPFEAVLKVDAVSQSTRYVAASEEADQRTAGVWSVVGSGAYAMIAGALGAVVSRTKDWERDAALTLPAASEA